MIELGGMQGCANEQRSEQLVNFCVVIAVWGVKTKTQINSKVKRRNRWNWSKGTNHEPNNLKLQTQIKRNNKHEQPTLQQDKSQMTKNTNKNKPESGG